jgi:hypothetical protein
MRIKSFSDPAAEKGDGYSRRYYLTLTEGQQIKRALPDCSPYSGHFRIRGQGASADQWISAIKVPVREEPNQIINDGEKLGGIDRAEPHRIRINVSAGAD